MQESEEVEPDVLTKIFRQYDVRGTFPTEINERIVERIGRAYGLNESVKKAKHVLVAHDVRLSSPQLALALIRGISFSAPETKVAFAGMLPLGAAVFHANKTGAELAYITASHLPAGCNGMKLFHPNCDSWPEQENLALRDAVTEEGAENVKTKHTVVDPDAVSANYVRDLVMKVKPKQRIRVVLDCGNGAASAVAPRLFAMAGFDVKALWAQPDGRFPNRSPDPLADPLSRLSEAVRSEHASLGIAYDGDGDRMCVVDDAGNKLPPERTSAVLLAELLKKVKGPIIATAECSRLIDDTAKKFDRQIIRVPVGHTHLMEAAHKNNAAFGVEVSGHYALPALVKCDDSLAISYYFACVVSGHHLPLSTQLSTLPQYPCFRQNFVCEDEEKFSVINRVKLKMSKENTQIDDMDGLRIDFPDGWVLMRASNTEPKIRLTVEAKTQERLEQLKEEFTSVIEREIGGVYKSSFLAKLVKLFGRKT